MPLILDKIYAPLLFAGLILLLKIMPWLYDIALGGTDRIVAMIATAIFAMVRFVIRFIQSLLFMCLRDRSMRYKYS